MEDLTRRGRNRIYRLVAHLAHADEELAHSEREVLDELREELGIDAKLAQALEQEALESQGLTLKSSEEEVTAALEALARVMLADGVLHPEEAKRLRRIGKAVGLTDNALAKAVHRAMWERNRAAQEREETSEDSDGSGFELIVEDD